MQLCLAREEAELEGPRWPYSHVQQLELALDDMIGGKKEGEWQVSFPLCDLH